MSVTLAKLSDSAPVASPFASRQWQNTVKLACALYSTFGDDQGVSLYEGLSDNDLTVLQDTFPRGFVNLPTLVKGQSSTTDTVSSVDYSDGYGGTYAPGE
jgi:hypothetical protein